MPTQFDPQELLDALHAVHLLLPDRNPARIETKLSKGKLSRLIREIAATADGLNHLVRQLDPIRPPERVLDPSDPKTTGMLIAQLLESLDMVPLAEVDRVYGAGVYALYYAGPFTAYEPIAGTKVPIYVGKADPEEPHARTPRDQGPRLSSRLGEHAKTIRKAGNLDIADFGCRSLVVQSGWQKAAEDNLIHRYRPIWNSEVGICPGFGKHGDRARRERSAWDILHPGRAWADDQSSRSGRTPREISASIAAHFRELLAEDQQLWSAQLDPAWVKADVRR